jgi:hypothetical protein
MQEDMSSKGTVKLITSGELDITLPEKHSDPGPYWNQRKWTLTVDDDGNVIVA